MGPLNKRYCTCGVKPLNRYSAGSGISGGGSFGASNHSYSSYRPASTNDSDVIFLAGLIVGAVVGILVACAFVLVF